METVSDHIELPDQLMARGGFAMSVDLSKFFYTPTFVVIFSAFAVVVPFFLVIFMIFIPDGADRRWTDTESAEECLMLGREWSEYSLSCDMAPVFALFKDHVSKHGRSTMSEHLAFNKYKEIAEKNGWQIKLRGCLYLLQTELVKQGVKVESVYDEDTVDSCSKFIGRGS